MTRRIALAAAVSAALLAAPRPAAAATRTNTLNVTATVLGMCTIDPATLDFGPYNPASPTDLDAPPATITVRCTTGSRFTVDLGTGNDAITGWRRMSRAANGVTEYLEYQLFSDAGHANVWTTGGASATMETTGAGQHPQTFSVYGRIRAGQQTLSMGTYTDSVVMTVNF